MLQGVHSVLCYLKLKINQTYWLASFKKCMFQLSYKFKLWTKLQNLSCLWPRNCLSEGDFFWPAVPHRSTEATSWHVVIVCEEAIIQPGYTVGEEAWPQVMTFHTAGPTLPLVAACGGSFSEPKVIPSSGTYVLPDEGTTVGSTSCFNMQYHVNLASNGYKNWDLASRWQPSLPFHTPTFLCAILLAFITKFKRGATLQGVNGTL